MYAEEESGPCFDPSSMQGGLQAEDGFSQTHVPNSTPSYSMEELSYPQNPSQGDASAAAMDIELQQQLDQCYGNTNHHHQSGGATHLMQEVMVHDSNQLCLPSCDQPNWDDNTVQQHDVQDMSFSQYHHQHHHQDHHQHHQDFNSSAFQEAPYPPTPDLLNFLHLPRCSASPLLPNSSISFTNPPEGPANFPGSLGCYLSEIPNPGPDGASGSTTSVLYDPLLPLNLPPQPPLFRELMHSLPHGYNLPVGSRTSTGSLFGGGVEEREAIFNGGFHQDIGDHAGHFDNGVLEFSNDMNCLAKGRYGNNKDTKHFATERQRRQHLNGKYTALRSLVPNPTKADRASVVGDAIEYIKELLRTVNELKILVEKKRCGKERIKRHKTENDDNNTMVRPAGDQDQTYNNGPSLRSSWLQRKSKNTEVDVRIIDDEVTIKLFQQKRINCLLFVAKVLEELQLDLHHVAGGLIGDYYSFLFNTKICEGSSVYASAIASKLIEVVDRQYAAIPPTSSSY